MSTTDTNLDAREIAEVLLSIGAVLINVAEPFTYASGIRSPIYTDNRLIMSHPRERRVVIEKIAQRLTAEIGVGAVDAIAGVATGGIPFAAWLADRLDLPMVYVRDAPKGHGRGHQVEGDLRPGQRVVVVEEMVTTGGSALRAVDGLREAGAEIAGCTVIFTYESPAAARAFTHAKVPLLALCGVSTLLEVATSTGRISRADAGAVRSWLGTLEPG